MLLQGRSMGQLFALDTDTCEMVGKDGQGRSRFKVKCRRQGGSALVQRK
jgi:hypothetical protein